VLSTYNLLCAQLVTLSADLRPVLRHFVVHPQACSLEKSTPWWRENALPLMLSVKLEPAMEAERAQDEAQMGHRPGAHDALLRRVEARNAALTRAVDTLQLRRLAITKAMEAQRRLGVASVPSPAPEDALKLLAAAQWGEGLGRNQQQRIHSI
jgi:hypothetical protein